MYKIIFLIVILYSGSYAQIQSWNAIYQDNGMDNSKQWIKNIVCNDSNHCFAVGDRSGIGYAGVLRTTDGGKSWIQKLPFNATTMGLRVHGDANNLCSSPDNSTIVISIQFKKLLISNDSGSTWRIVTIDSVKPRIIGQEPDTSLMVHMQDKNNGVALYDKFVFITTDCWHTWKRDTMNFPNYKDVGYSLNFPVFQSIDSFQVIFQYNWKIGSPQDTISPDRFVLGITTNHGITWQTKLIPLKTIQSPQGIFFLTLKEGWLHGLANSDINGAWKNIIYKTVDGGTTWIELLNKDMWDTVTHTSSSFLSNLKFYNSLFGVAIGNYKILRTTDGGRSWNFDAHRVIEKNLNPWFWGLSIPSLTRAFIGNARGTIFRWDAYDTVTTTSVQDADVVEGNGMRLYPSPASTRITLGYDEGLLKESIITIQDEIGRTVLQTRAEQGTIQMEVDIHTIPNGVYSLRVMSQTEVRTIPFVVNR